MKSGQDLSPLLSECSIVSSTKGDNKGSNKASSL